jgi:hypothetical protein
MDFKIVDSQGNTMGYIVNSPSATVAHLEAIKYYPNYQKLVIIDIFQVPLSIVNKVLRPTELIHYVKDSKWCLN